MVYRLSHMFQSELIAGVEIEDPTAYADLVCSLF